MLEPVRAPRPRARPVAILLALAAGRGGGDDEDEAVSVEELRAKNSVLDVQMFWLAEFEKGASTRAYGRMLDAVARLIAAHRNGLEVEDEMKDAASSLDKCGQSDEARRLDRELVD